jgi:hypothetical protein
MKWTDVFGITHAPARLAARVLLSSKYLFRGTDSKHWIPDSYARARYGEHYRWKPWLLFDLEQLERTTSIINSASDEELSKVRDSQLEVAKLVAVVVSLINTCLAKNCLNYYVGCSACTSRSWLAIAS